MNILTEKDFINMPWKNGGGFTSEIFCIKDPLNGDVVFRISEASVRQSGPFSIFPEIDRILMLTSGQGFLLNFQDKKIKVDQPLKPIFFQGEEEIICDLIDNACVDFNVMTARRYGRSNISIKKMEMNEEITSTSDVTCFYLPKLKELYVSEQREVFINSFEQDLLIYQIELNKSAP